MNIFEHAGGSRIRHRYQKRLSSPPGTYLTYEITDDLRTQGDKEIEQP